MDTYAWLELGMLVGEAALLVLLPIEFWRLHRSKRLTWSRVAEMAGSTSAGVPTFLLSGALYGLIFAGFVVLHSVWPIQIEVSALSAVLCVLLVDFLYYWDHRIGHEVRLFWALGHSVHHSSNQYDPSTALRVSVLDGPFTAWIYLPAVLVGFPPLLILASIGLVVAYQTWLHTEAIGKLPWLDPWLNTPSNHRVHHASQAHYLDKNYGAVLIIWDRLFGTYEPEKAAPIYGLTEPLNSSNPIAIHFFELVKLARALVARSWRARWKLLWSKPGTLVDG